MEVCDWLSDGGVLVRSVFRLLITVQTRTPRAAFVVNEIYGIS
jgi:hypothetical protein